jgi:hypothetical protein
MLFRGPKLIKVALRKLDEIGMGNSLENSRPYHVVTLSFEHVGFGATTVLYSGVEYSRT